MQPCSAPACYGRRKSSSTPLQSAESRPLHRSRSFATNWWRPVSSNSSAPAGQDVPAACPPPASSPRKAAKCWPRPDQRWHPRTHAVPDLAGRRSHQSREPVAPSKHTTALYRKGQVPSGEPGAGANQPPGRRHPSPAAPSSHPYLLPASADHVTGRLFAEAVRQLVLDVCEPEGNVRVLRMSFHRLCTLNESVRVHAAPCRGRQNSALWHVLFSSQAARSAPQQPRSPSDPGGMPVDQRTTPHHPGARDRTRTAAR